MTEKASGRVLLPSNVTPTRYTMKLTPDLAKFSYEGSESVELTITSPTNSITMHSKELSYWSVSYTDSSTNITMEAAEITLYPKSTTVKFTFPSEIQVGTGVISIVFSGILNTAMAGFYRSSYTTIKGEKKVMANTQFESLDARRAFPCWDEPSVKAVFSITLGVPSELTAFSNMPEKSFNTSADGKIKEILYLDTPKMSTYLVAFCIGEFDYVQDLSKNGVIVRCYTPVGKSSHGTFALECAIKSLDLYDDFFGIPYPLPKLDMVGVPEFAAGAMENWGLVVYREVDLFIDPVKASSDQKQRVCTVVTHELAHQWFGNLVTMAWWDDLWLNEGFASWCENMAADALFPQWNMWEQFITSSAAAALRLDSLRTSHPIQVPIKHAEEVEEVFDAISYCKGSAVVRMIHAVLGREKFQKGLMVYMDRHKYGNTETFDLWNAWTEASGLPIGEMMKSWTEQMGFPLITVTHAAFSEKSVTIQLKQEWYLSDGSIPDVSESSLWCVPILINTCSGLTDEVFMMRDATMSITLPLAAADDWVKLNANQECPFRVCYTPEMIKRLSGGIQQKQLSTSDRIGVLTDSFALVKSGHLAASELLKLLGKYEGETDSTVWEAIEGVLASLSSISKGNELITSEIKKFATKIIMPLVGLVGWDATENDEHLTKLLRGTMVNLLSMYCYDDENVKAEATKRFSKFLENADDMASLPSDLRTPVFKIMLKNGGVKEYEQVKGYFYTATDTAEKKHVFSALGATPDASLKLATLDWTTSGEVKLQDFFYAIGSVHGSSAEGRDLTWKYFQDNYERLRVMLKGTGASLMDAVIVYSCGGFTTKEKADEVESYFNQEKKKVELKQNLRKIGQTVDGMRGNAKFRALLESSELNTKEFWGKL